MTYASRRDLAAFTLSPILLIIIGLGPATVVIVSIIVQVVWFSVWLLRSGRL